MKKGRIIFLIAVIVMFAVCEVSAQETGSGAVSLSEGETISLNVIQMELPDVLRLIAKKANLSIVIGKEVTGLVTIRLKNVNLWQALTAILQVNGFTYREEKGIIRVVKLGEAIEAKRVLLTEVIALKYTQAENIKKVSQHLLSSSGTMETNLRSNALIITDSTENIEKIRQLVAKLDTGVPMFKLTGILSSAEVSSIMINGRILKLGDTIGEYTVSEIGEDNVMLKKGDQIITLMLREILPTLESAPERIIGEAGRDYEAEIKAYARKKWPDDYEMQLYEFNIQMEALKQIWNLPSTTDYNESILSKAMTNWGEQYDMVIYEYNLQLEAYKEMQR